MRFLIHLYLLTVMFSLDPNPKPEPFLLCLYQMVTVEAVHQFFEELRARKRRRTNAGYQ